MTDREICQAAMKKFGPQAQTVMVFEEMSELQKELCKSLRGEDRHKEIAEEIADVLVVLEQMIILHDCEQAVIEIKEEKLERLRRRIEKEVQDR